MRYIIAAVVALAVCLTSGTALASTSKVGSGPGRAVVAPSGIVKASKSAYYPNRYTPNRPKRAIIPAYWIYRIVKCGGGGYLGYISSAGWKWYERAVSVTFGCILAI